MRNNNSRRASSRRSSWIHSHRVKKTTVLSSLILCGPVEASGSEGERRDGRARNKNLNTGRNSPVLISLGTARRSRSVDIRRTHACERSLSLTESTRAINILIRPLLRMSRPVIGYQYWDGIVSVRSNYRSNAIHRALLWTGLRCGVRVQVTHYIYEHR